MNIVYLLPFIVAIAATLSHDEWETYKKTYGKSYKTTIEDQFRMKIFLNNKANIDRHNALYEQGLSTYERGINQFTDMTMLELSEKMNGYRPSDQIGDSKYGQPYVHNGVTASDSVDWRTSGCYTSKGSRLLWKLLGLQCCQNCFAKSKLVGLSEQQLVDCGGPYGLNGCGGGNNILGFRYVILNGGIDREDTYPYEAKNGPCRYNPRTIGGTASSYSYITQAGCEACLKDAVSTVGPISVGMDARQTFMDYKSGIYYEPACSSTSLNHAVLVVGYGTAGGQDYWLVKNSWSTRWGEQGYIRMARNRQNNCGIATDVSWPNV